MRILIASHCPLQPEFGAAQVHMNLAAALRAHGHDVELWSPPAVLGGHWSTGLVRLRAHWRAFLPTAAPADVVDAPPFFTVRSAAHPKALWVSRATQPDLLYLWAALAERRLASVRDAAKTAGVAAWSAGFAATVVRGWSAADSIMCHTSAECRWIGKLAPWLRPKLATFDGALSDPDRASLALVRHARKPRVPGAPVRYIWIGRWTEHKGTRRLLEFLTRRLGEAGPDVFTVAGCGAAGSEALATLSSSGRLQVIPSYDRSQLPGLLAEHDAGLFTSQVEGWGLALNEMLEAGLPVYATRAGGVEDLATVVGAMIQPFPPPVNATLPGPLTEETARRYDNRFRWEVVAGRYVEAITTRKSGRAGPTL